MSLIDLKVTEEQIEEASDFLNKHWELIQNFTHLCMPCTIDEVLADEEEALSKALNNLVERTNAYMLENPELLHIFCECQEDFDIMEKANEISFKRGFFTAMLLYPYLLP